MIKLTVLHKELSHFVNSIAGFSILVEAYGLKILYDTAIEDQIIKNSKKVKVDISKLDFVVLSHGHWDHTDGLKNLDYKGIKNIIAHPDCFKKKWNYKKGYFCGCSSSSEELKKKTNLILTKSPHWLLKDKIVFLGEIPRVNDFESKAIEDKTEENECDFVMDDSALCIINDKGVIVISGCSHSGICNIIEYAEKISKKKVFAVLGGFHLFNKEITDKTIKYFKQKNITQIFPAHCLDDYAIREFVKIGGKKVKTLQEFEF